MAIGARFGLLAAGVLLALFSGCERQEKREPAAPPVAPAPAAPNAPRTVGEWPSSREELLFAWETHKGLKVAYGADGKEIKFYDPTPRGRARLDGDYAMVLQGGSCEAAEVSAFILASVKKSQAFTLEACVRPALPQQNGAVVGWGREPERWNWALVQQGGKFVLRVLQGDDKPPQRDVELGPSLSGHIVVTWGGRMVVAYQDGKETARQAAGLCDTAFREALPVVFGSGSLKEDGWQGTLEGVALYARVLGPAEVAANASAYAARVAKRTVRPQVALSGRLVQRSPAPDPTKTGNYFRALAVYEYQVEKVLAGKCPAKRIRVAHWVMMERRILPISERALQGVYPLTLELWDLHPEVLRECKTDALLGNDIDDLPFYLDVGPVAGVSSAAGDKK